MDFWHSFLLLALFIPLTILWITCIVDVIFRSEKSGVSRAIWVLAIILFPLGGAIAYIAFGGMHGQHVSETTMSSPRDDALRMTGRTP
jgi:Phospholipase_D-nuclease N-terminal